MEKNEYNFVQETPVKKKKKHTLLRILVILIVLSAVVSLYISITTTPEQLGYKSIDLQQGTDEHYQSIAEYMDTYLESLDYFPVGYTVEWIGYSKYADMYDVAEYEEMQTGGYYSYTGTLSTGEMASADISTYWGEGEEPVILNLNIETLTSENPIIPFSNDAIVSCWNTYYQKAYENSNSEG